MPWRESPSVRVAYLCDFPLWKKHTAPEHLKHELLFKKRLGKKLPLKRTASSYSSNCYLLQAINEDRDAYFCSSLSLFLSVALPDIIVHFNFCTGTLGKREVWIPFLMPIYLWFSCNKYERSVCCHFTLEFNMCHFLCCFTGRIRKQQKGVTGAWRTTVDFCE